ncbi:MAG: GGDEF domain-containing protein [Terracidiphilus sp.]
MMDAGGTRLRGAATAGTYLIGRVIALLALASACASGAHAQPAPISSLRAIRALSNAQASQALPVDFEATVTYVRTYERALFVQDGDAAVYVDWPTQNLLKPGDRVQVTGETKASFHPIVVAKSVTLVHHGVVPAPVPATFDQLIRADFDCQYVTVNATVRDAETVVKLNVRSTLLQLHMDGGDIEAAVDVDNPDVLGSLLDAEVQVTGAVSGRFDGKMQETGIVLHVSSLDGVRVIRRAASSPWDLPITPMDQVLSGYHVTNLSKRLRVHGTITYYRPGSAAVLQEGDKSLWLITSSIAPLHVGNAADATGFPDLHNGFPALGNAEIQDSGTAAPIPPKPATWEQLSTNKNLFDLVSIEATVEAEVRSAAQDEYVLNSDGNLFSAVYKHASEDEDGDPPSPMKHLAPGSKVRVTGVCFTGGSSPLESRVPFDILLRSPDDIVVLEGAPWFTAANLARLAGLLFLLVLGVGVWGWMLRKRVQQQTAAIKAQSEADAAQERRTAQLEQWRSRVLEDINSSRPLGDIVEHITEMMSYMLNGAPCWCEITEGPVLGHPPAKKEKMRTISREIHSRTGLVLGTLYAAFDAEQHANEKDEQDALAAGVRLATLSIETRKLYSDLVHRSEFDLLTDMYNRFSLDRHLQELIDQCHASGANFGLIYVDLDDFKLVNDLYGHRVGDLYLQEVSLRMKRQLRTGDVLGRIGGDEFAALVTVVNGRADVDEIATRLERCFDAPFALEGYVLRGAASVGLAIYPDDGATSDSLLSAADTAMYAAKNSRRGTGKLPSRRSG